MRTPVDRDTRDEIGPLGLVVGFVIVVGWVLWRTFTAIVDGWADVRRGKLPPDVAMWWAFLRGSDDE